MLLTHLTSFMRSFCPAGRGLFGLNTSPPSALSASSEADRLLRQYPKMLAMAMVTAKELSITIPTIRDGEIGRDGGAV